MAMITSSINYFFDPNIDKYKAPIPNNI